MMYCKKLIAFFILSTGLLLYVPGSCVPLLFALPEDATVVAGNAQIEQVSPERLNIIQTTDKAIIDWRTFSIDVNEHTDFQMPSSSSVNLSRVTGGIGSEILGRLTSNGKLMLINPNGIMFGKDARVDVNGLVATTIDIPNQDFMSGNYNFNIISDAPGVIANYGQINVAEGGLLAFVAPGVENYGLINARLGKVTLASGNTFTLDFYGDQLITLGVDSKVLEQVIGIDGSPLASLINNSGEIIADGGIVTLDVNAAGNIIDNVINMTGMIQAQTAAEQNGEIILSGGTEGIVNVSGTLDASGKNTGELGGTVHVLGEKVGLFDTAFIDVSGDAGAGTVLIGGDFQGKGEVQNAKNTYVGANAKIFADALTNGDGGKVIVWGDNTTRYYGSISARGGAESGNGGFAEVSGKNYLDFQGVSDLSAANGSVGMLLLDPDTLTIADGGAGDLDGANNDDLDPQTYAFAENEDGTDAVLDADAVTAALDNSAVTLQANVDIIINEAIDYSSGITANGLYLEANDDIILNAGISLNGGVLSLTADFDSSSAGAISGSGVLNPGGGDLILTAGSGIGTSGSKIQATDAGSFSTESTTGGTFINYTDTGGGLTINDTVINTSGDIEIISNGNIEISTGGISTPGNVSITATGSAIDGEEDTFADISANGNITLTAAGIGDTTTLEIGGHDANDSTLTVSNTGTSAETVYISTVNDLFNNISLTVADADSATLISCNGLDGIDISPSGSNTSEIQSIVTNATGKDFSYTLTDAVDNGIDVPAGGTMFIGGNVSITCNGAFTVTDLDVASYNLTLDVGSVADGGDSATDITTTGTLAITASGAVGSGNALETSITNLGASTVGGALNLNNGNTALAITDSVSADSIDLTANNTITIQSSLSATNNINVTTTTGDIIGDGGLVFGISFDSSSGSIDLDAANDIILGQNDYSDIYTNSGSGSITLTAGNNISVDNGTYIESYDGNIGITAANNFQLLDGFITTDDVGNISITATNGSISVASDSNGLSSNTGGLTPSLGTITLSAGTNITIEQNLQAESDISLTTTTGDIIGDGGLVFGITWETNSGSIDLDAGNDIILGQNDYVELYTYNGSGSITLTAGQDIKIDNNSYVWSKDGDINITANRNFQLLSTSSDYAAVGTDDVGNISITATTGSISFGSNTGYDVFSGTYYGASSYSGTVTLSAATGITLESGVYGEGDVTATTTAGDIIADAGTSGYFIAFESNSGSVDLDAGQDILLGQNDETDVYTYNGTGTITLTAGRDIIIDNDAYIESNTGDINITADRNFQLLATTYDSAWVGTDDTGNVNITATTGGITIAATTYGISSEGVSGGNISLITDTFAIGSNIYSSGGSLTLEPVTSGRTIGIGGGTGDFNLDATEIGYLNNGFSSITIGKSGGTGAIDCDAVTFNDPLTLYGGALTVTGLNLGANNLTLNVASVADGGGATDITAGTLSMTLSGAFGSAGDAIETAIDNLGASTVGGVLNLDNGTTSLDITGAVTTAAANGNITLDVGTGTLYSSTGSLASGSGAILLNADTMNLTGTITGTGSLTLQPDTINRTVGIGGGSGSFELNDSEIALFQDGFSSITIGNSSGTGAIDCDTVTFNDNLTIRGSGASLTVTGLNLGTNTLTLNVDSVVDGGGGIIDITAGLLIIDAINGIGSADAIETTVTSMDIDNTTSGNISLYETDGVALVKINQAGPGDLTLSYEGTLTGESNATVNGGTLTLTNRNPAPPEPEPEPIPPATSKKAVEETTSYVSNINNYMNAAILIPGNSSLTSPIYAIRNTDPRTQPYVIDVFSESFDIVWPGKGFEEAYESLGVIDNFWTTVGLMQH